MIFRMEQISNQNNLSGIYSHPLATMGQLPSFVEKNKTYLLAGAGLLAAYFLFLKKKIRRRKNPAKRKMTRTTNKEYGLDSFTSKEKALLRGNKWQLHKSNTSATKIKGYFSAYISTSSDPNDFYAIINPFEHDESQPYLISSNIMEEKNFKNIPNAIAWANNKLKILNKDPARSYANYYEGSAITFTLEDYLQIVNKANKRKRKK